MFLRRGENARTDIAGCCSHHHATAESLFHWAPVFEAGSHVYLEKPFTVTADEAKSLIELANHRNLKIVAGHNYQLTLEMLEMRRLVGEGYLGGSPVHLESYWPYDLGDTSYVGPVLGNPSHWVRQLPGQLIHNIISHGIARLAEFLDDDLVEIVARAHQSEQFRNLGGKEVLDELRVLIRDKRNTTAFFCFSTQIEAPTQSTARLRPRKFSGRGPRQRKRDSL